GFEVPERRVDRVVFGSFSGIWKTIRQHSPVHVFGEFAQNAPRNIEAAGGESQSGQGDHGVAPPIREPRISRNNSLSITPADDVLVGCRRECAHELVLGWSSRSHFGPTLRLLVWKPAGRADIENLSRSDDCCSVAPSHFESKGKWIKEILDKIQPAFTLERVVEILVPVALRLQVVRVMCEVRSEERRVGKDWRCEGAAAGRKE